MRGQSLLDMRPTTHWCSWGLYAILNKGAVGQWGRGVGFQKESKQFTGSWKSRHVVNKLLLGPSRNSGTQRETGFARYVLRWICQASFPEAGFEIWAPLGWKGESQKFFHSFLFLINQSKINILKGTCWGGKSFVHFSCKHFILESTWCNLSLLIKSLTLMVLKLLKH